MRKFPKLLSTTLAIFLLAGVALNTNRAQAAPSVADVTGDTPQLDFPNTITFNAQINGSAAIASVVLEYGTEELTCGDVIAKAYPQFTPDSTVSVQWTWDMRQTGSLPPGTSLWWRWRYQDMNGKEYVTEKQTVIWLDSVHNWQTQTDGLINVHWYDHDKAFAQTMVDAAKISLDRNFKSAGLKPVKPINIYVYSSYEDLRDAILYEAGWVGGEAFPENNIVIMGLSQSDAAWDQNTVIHELTHVLIGNLTFSCLSFVPQWLNEGLAVYSEGEITAEWQSSLDTAIRTDTLPPLRTLNGRFAEGSSAATLSYSQSYSVVKYLIETDGQDKMNSLLVTFRDGGSIDDALQSIYGFNVDGLDDAWRKSVGAQPVGDVAQPTAIATPTYVPTIIPISGAPLAITPTPFIVPTSSTNGNDSPFAPTGNGGPPLTLTLLLAGICCLVLLVVGVFILGFVIRSQNQKGGKS